jgi:hypothetical protein
VLTVTWTVIAVRSSHEARTYSELEQLATWPRTATADRDAGVRELLVRASSVLHAPRIALLWEETDGGSYAAHYEAH